MVDSHGVPESMEALVAQYEPFIKWAIKRYAKRRLTLEEAEDARQAVYLRVLKYDYLTRCRTYYANHSGRFTTSLSMLVRNMMLSREKKDPMRGAVSFSFDQKPGSGCASAHKKLQKRALRDTKADRAAASLDAKIRSEQVMKKLRALVPTQAAAIDELVADPYRVPKIPQWHWQKLQQAARALEDR